MGRAPVMPFVYSAVILVEVVWLGWLYGAAPPPPTSALSLGLGWAGLASMVAMLGYSVARRSRWLRELMRLSAWLHLHIFLGVQGVVLVFFHSIHVFSRDAPLNWLNPGLLNLLAVGIVFASGVFGRYLYSWLPRTIGGEHRQAKDVESELAGMPNELPAPVTSLLAEPVAATGLLGLVRADLKTRAALRALAHLDVPRDALVLARQRVSLQRRLSVWMSAERVFRRWIILHRPIAAIMYVLSVVHVLLAYMFTPSLGR